MKTLDAREIEPKYEKKKRVASGASSQMRSKQKLRLMDKDVETSSRRELQVAFLYP